MDMSCNASDYSILVVLEDKATVYMRPAAMLTKIANRFESDVVVEHEKERVNGKSLLEIINLGIGTGANFRVFTSGNDASNAIQAIKVFFKRFFLDGEVSDALAEDCAISDKCTDIKIEHNEEDEMEQKKKTIVKRTLAPVKQDKKKVQTFVFPHNGTVNEVLLAGDFNDWTPEPMAKRDSGFHAAVKLEPGVYQYKFVVDGQWQMDPFSKGNVQNDFGTANSVLLVD